MPVISAPHAFNEGQLYVDLEPVYERSLFLKCEGFNFAGSIKLKAATEMVDAAERDGVLKPDSILVESSSGNLGVALSMIAASKGYRFLCVTDSRCNLSTRLLMKALGSRVLTISDLDANGGFLGARLNYVRALCDADDRYVWLGQYTNPNNWQAHYRRTAPEISQSFPRLDVLFVGAGTTGTLMGCARYFRQWHRPVRIVAVDAVGSVIFGGAPGRRMIPGLGMSMRPPLLDESYVDEVIHVEETDTIRACHRLARHGFLFGGSTGTVVSGAMRWLAEHGDGRGLTAVAISPDLGERYLDTVYQSNWLQDLYGEGCSAFDEGPKVPGQPALCQRARRAAHRTTRRPATAAVAGAVGTRTAKRRFSADFRGVGEADLADGDVDPARVPGKTLTSPPVSGTGAGSWYWKSAGDSVLMPDLNEDEAPDLLAWAVENDYDLRFIEQMPLDTQHGKREGMGTAVDILASLRTRFGLTAEGAPASPDEETARVWRLAIGGKKAGASLDDRSFDQPDRPMSAVGGWPGRRRRVIERTMSWPSGSGV